MDSLSNPKTLSVAVTRSPKQNNPSLKKPRKTKAIMTTKQFQKFKKLLTEQRFQIIDQIHHQEEEEKTLQSKDDKGFSDHGDDSAVELLEKLTDSEAKLVQKIDLALIRIEEQSYGICTACEKKIPLERLEAKPSVSLCRDCQTKHEENA
jgi:DnaK suppressor protein